MVRLLWFWWLIADVVVEWCTNRRLFVPYCLCWSWVLVVPPLRSSGQDRRSSYHDGGTIFASFTNQHQQISNHHNRATTCPVHRWNPCTLYATTTTTSTQLSTTTGTSTSLLAEEWMQQRLAKQVVQRVDLPWMIPEPIVLYALQRILRQLSPDVLSSQTVFRLQQLLTSESTPTNLADDMTKQEVQELADRMADDLFSKRAAALQIPILNETQQLALLRQILRIMLNSIATSPEEKHAAIMAMGLQTSRDLIQSRTDPTRRQRLIDALDAAIPIPSPLVQGTDYKRRILEAAVDLCSTLLESILPGPFLETLSTGQSTESVMAVKEYAIQSLNEKFNVIGLSEQQEETLIRMVVDIIFDMNGLSNTNWIVMTSSASLGNNTDAWISLRTPQEQVTMLESMERQLEFDLQMSQDRYEREQCNLRAHLDQTRFQLQALLRQQQQQLINDSNRNKNSTDNVKPTNDGLNRRRWSIRAPFRRRT